MIPISKDKRFEYKDEDTGIVYLIKPLVGSTEIIANEVRDEFQRIDAQKPDMKEVARLASKLVDLVLVGWRIPTDKETEYGEFPIDGKPSEMFTSTDLISMMFAIQKVNGLTKDEKKN